MASFGTLEYRSRERNLKPDRNSEARCEPGFYEAIVEALVAAATATLFIGGGIALELIVRHPFRQPARRAAKILAAIIVVGALCELLELTGVWHSKVDEILFASKLARLHDGLPNRMAPYYDQFS